MGANFELPYNGGNTALF